ncbi:MAG: hypothetical protein OEM29_09155 [Thermoplasmata archaeon]|nr:hypothetical protein [Thermoplasmata archaeon]
MKRVLVGIFVAGLMATITVSPCLACEPITLMSEDERYRYQWQVGEQPLNSPEITWTVHDMFGEPPGPWWDVRLDTVWDTERLLTSDPGSVAYLSNSEGPVDPNGFSDKGIIYAPYRWNVEGVNLPNADVHNPVFMPVMGTGAIAGAEATIETYCQYAHQAFWTDYVIPTWSSNPDWNPDFDPYLTGPYNDGWVTVTLINVTMNREAAEEWLGMGQLETPSDWWTANCDTYRSAWSAWMNWQGNDVYDIWCGYDWYLDEVVTMMDLEENSHFVTLKIFFTSWGYEALMTRWLLASQLSVHQPYMEDITMVVDCREDDCDFYLDAVAQWSLHCVKANETSPGDNAMCAWVWEPIGLDYMPSVSSHPSDYDPYVGFTYQSWNCGDPSYSGEIPYEVAPWAFNLPVYGRLVVEFPQGTDVVGYYGEPLPSYAMVSLWNGDSSAYDAIRYIGEMDLGYCMLGDAVWDYDEISKVLTVNGPYDFENPRDGDLLYHGAPWIEFNVVPPSL